MRLSSPVLVLVVLLVPEVFCKVFTRCELTRELSQPKHRIPSSEVAIWVCIARHESDFNTSAIGNLNADGSGDHGLFQISDQYWCSPPGVGLACGLNCDQLEDDDIKDDVVCARRIYRAHKRRTGNGFTAWAVYGYHCSGDVSGYTAGCDHEDTTTTTTEEPWSSTTSTTEIPYSSTTENPFQESTSEEPYVKFTSEEPSSESEERRIRPTKSDLSHPRRIPSITRTVPRQLKSTPSTTAAGKAVLTYRVKSGPGAASRTPGSGTSSLSVHQPRFSDPGLDPATVWSLIHNDPRFLDQTS